MVALKGLRGTFKVHDPCPELGIEKDDEIHALSFGIFHIRRTLIGKINPNILDQLNLISIKNPTKVYYRV